MLFHVITGGKFILISTARNKNQFFNSIFMVFILQLYLVI